MVFPNFEQKPIVLSAMKQKSEKVNDSDLMREIEELHRQLKEVQLKIEGYEIMGDILEEQYGIDLLNKSEANQSPDSENGTLK